MARNIPLCIHQHASKRLLYLGGTAKRPSGAWGWIVLLTVTHRALRLSDIYIRYCIFIFTAFLLLPNLAAQASLRNVKIGDKMPQFSLQNLEGKTVTWQPGKHQALVVVFLPSDSRRMVRVLTDLEKITQESRKEAANLVILAVTTSPQSKDNLLALPKQGKVRFPILLDTQLKLWGQLGVIAAPTTIVVAPDDTIQWTKAGYGYDFLPSIRSHVALATGKADSQTTEQKSTVNALVNATPQARARRHLQMARIFARKGRWDAAVTEAQKAAELTPDSIEVLSELGQFLCRTGQNQAAIKIAQKIKSEKKQEQALAALIQGWALRQLAEYTKAEQMLREATLKNPKSARAFYELGKIYQARNQTEKAMLAYHHALAITFKESTSPNLKIDLDK
jgi:tetratricopeptide (TPR) repeat protein